MIKYAVYFGAAVRYFDDEVSARQHLNSLRALSGNDIGIVKRILFK